MLVMPTFAQSVSKQINDVKRSSRYLSAEATLETEEDAYKLAEELLTKQISEYVAEQKDLKSAPNVIVKDVAGKAEKMQMNRGTMVRVFLYVKKSDILAADNTRILVQPANKTPLNKSEPTSTVEPIAEETDSMSVATIEEKESTPKVQDNVSWQKEVMNRIFQSENIAKAQEVLKRLKVEMKIKRYGSPDSCKNAEKCYWIIFEDNGNIITILGTGRNERINYKTMEKDALTNYTGKGAMWFTLAI